MDCWRRPMSFQFCVMPRLRSSFSPTVASFMSSAAALGIFLSLSFLLSHLSIHLHVYLCTCLSAMNAGFFLLGLLLCLSHKFLDLPGYGCDCVQFWKGQVASFRENLGYGFWHFFCLWLDYWSDLLFLVPCPCWWWEIRDQRTAWFKAVTFWFFAFEIVFVDISNTKWGRYMQSGTGSSWNWP